MLLGLPQSSPTDSPSVRNLCPVKLLKDRYYTANRFSVLADLHQSSSDPSWPFDFVPAVHRSAKRRGRRGGKHHKLRRAGQTRNTERRKESIDELCARFATVSISDNDSLEAAYKHDQPNTQHTIPILSVDSVRHHWAPQFRPDTLLPPSTTLAIATPTNSRQPTLLRRPEPRIAPLEASPIQSETLDVVHNNSRFFPLSAFLASPDPTGCYSAASKHSLSTPPPPQPLHSPLPQGLPEPSNCVSVFKPSPSMLITAPIGSPLPFINSPKVQTPLVVSKEVFENTLPTPVLANRDLKTDSPSPEVHQELMDFLDMGHANPCWCANHSNLSAHARPCSDVLSEYEDMDDLMHLGAFSEDDWTIVSPSSGFYKPGTPDEVSEEDEDYEDLVFIP